MRKLMFWLLFAAAACACCKQEPEKVRVRFGVSMDMNQTKTIAKMFQELKPDLSDVEFTVGELDGVKVGDEIELLEGVYDVTGEYAPWMAGTVFGGHRVSELPAFIVADEVEVSAGDQEITVQADWNCWALIVENAEVASATFDGLPRSMGGYSLGDYGVFFIEACQGSSWVLRIVPSSAMDKTTEWTIEADERDRAGKWYLYHPDGRVDVIGDFNVNCPSWVEGTVE